jgi:hypothetical protein
MSTIANFTIDSIRQWNKTYAEAINPDLNQNKNNILPLIINQSMMYNTKSHTPYVGINPINSNIISSGFYKDLNKDKTVQRTFTKYYFYKILDKWFYKDFLPLLAFVDISSDKPQLIKSLSQYDIKKLSTNSSEEIEKKINYLEKILITKDMVKYVLKKICKDNNINWYDLNKNEKKIKTIFYNFLLVKLKESIKKYSDI